ncbi:MAG: HAD-IA family hydrolase [Trueperaceae bacterium]|nr:HAD-IA family hydrolase [Trueperaceae bacterium]
MTTPDLSRFDAVLFDLDGVLTPTAEVHMRAWAALFTDYLGSYSDKDYFDHIDGKPRYEGVDKQLRSRGIELPWGDPADPPTADTVCGLGNRKDEEFNRILREEGVAPYPGSLALLARLESMGMRMAVVSSSRNATRVLAAAGLAERFPVVIDGLSAAAEGLAGKPSPATYLRAAEILGVEPARAVVVEDAFSGVEAGRRGEFGLVIGVDRGAGAAELLAAGADVVVSDLAELATPGFLDRSVYPVDEWRLIERSRPTPARRGQFETVFALGNGYLGLRGNPDEGGEAHEHGTFINGFHETWPIRYPEAAYGFAEVGQTILNLPDAKTIELEVDGEHFDPDSSPLDDYERVLDMAAGVLERRFVWRLANGKRVEVRSKRMVSFESKHLALIEYSLRALDEQVSGVLRSLLVDRQAPGSAVGEDEPFDPRRSENMTGALQPQRHGVTGVRAHLAHTTRASGLGVAVMALNVLYDGDFRRITATSSPQRAETKLEFPVRKGETVTLRKYVAYHDGPSDDLDALLSACSTTIDDAYALGAEKLFAGQRRWLESFWTDADVRVGGQSAIQQAVRWNLFQILQASARADGRGVSAKGVTGSGYSGHYFWDTEIYVLPYLIHSRPEIARAALEFRHALLPAARRRAAVMNEAGALFAWRTINGEEASAYYPAGTAQYHIDADITYAVAKYLWATAESGFASAEGADIAVETARMWATLGFFDAAGTFHINAVTGPDEYSAVVDDNFYTNAMAAFNLRFAAEVVAGLDPAARRALVERLGLSPTEPEDWLRAADAMALPYDQSRGVHVQDARFLEREPWDFNGDPPAKRPLLLHYHPLVIYRHQVLKQADLVLALYLHARLFSLDEKRADFDFYDPLTTGDSTLSAAVQSIIAAEVGYANLAMEYFEKMLYVDLADLHANTADGVHVASTGGAYQALVGGFGGMRDDGGVLRFDPRLPVGWSSLEFRVRNCGAQVQVVVESRRVTLKLVSGASLVLQVQGREVRLAGPEPVIVALN